MSLIAFRADRRSFGNQPTVENRAFAAALDIWLRWESLQAQASGGVTELLILARIIDGLKDRRKWFRDPDSPLKERAVLCQFSNCEKPAEFLLKNPPNKVRALCRGHLEALGIPDEDLPP